MVETLQQRKRSLVTISTVSTVPTVSTVASDNTTNPVLSSTSSNHNGLVVSQLLNNAGIETTCGNTTTTTKGGWCLREGLSHVVTVDNGRLLPIVVRFGVPQVYTKSDHQCRHTDDDSNTNDCNKAVTNMKNPTTCFESLCRIVAGQQLAGAAAQSVWKRLLETTCFSLTPHSVLALADQDMTTCLQKPAGLSAAKARSLVDLATHFQNGSLSDDFLTTAPETDVRTALLRVRGLGPWSCDMFLLFYLERPDVLPVGDLGVRKGIAKHFRGNLPTGSGPKGSLCPKKDLDRILKATAPYEPYRSIFSYYMWKVADTKDVYNHDVSMKMETTTTTSTKMTSLETDVPKAVTPDKKLKAKRPRVS